MCVCVCIYIYIYMYSTLSFHFWQSVACSFFTSFVFIIWTRIFFWQPLADAEGAKKHSMIELLKSYGGLSYVSSVLPVNLLFIICFSSYSPALLLIPSQHQCILPHYFEILRNAGGFSVKCNPEAYLQIVYDLLILKYVWSCGFCRHHMYIPCMLMHLCLGSSDIFLFWPIKKRKKVGLKLMWISILKAC